MPSIDLEEPHAELTLKMSPWPIDKINQDGKQEVDVVQVCLLAQILLLYTDQAQVENNLEISRLQDEYLRMLHRYLKLKYQQEANSKLVEGIMISSLAREAQ